jgi:ribosomal protein S20
LLGNKCDIEDGRTISREEISALASKYDAKHYEVSAESGQKVAAAFASVIGEIEKKVEKGAFEAAKPDRIASAQPQTITVACC